MRFAVASIANVWDRDLVQRHPTWMALVTALTRFRVFDVEDKRHLPAWTPCLWKPRARRSAGSNVHLVEHVSCAVLDYDAGETIAAASARFADWPHIIHTSFSHTPDAPRFRLVLPLARPCPTALWPLAWPEVAARAGLVDTKCKDVGRIYFVPAIRVEDQPHEAHVEDPGGALFDLDLDRLAALVPTAAPRPVRAAPRQVSPRRQAREINERLKTDPGARARAAAELGAHLVGDRATRIRCPSCGRNDVWYFITPREGGMRGAACNHANSCGWSGWLDELFKAAA